MSLKSYLARPFAAWEAAQIRRWSSDPVGSQRKVLGQLLRKGGQTHFGREHRLDQVRDAAGFRQAIPLRDYEQLKPWIERVKSGESDVLWPGKPAYFAKTSGTTSGTKYIPLTPDSIPNHIGTARAALTSYIHSTGKTAFVDGKMIFLQGSPVLTQTGGIPTGRLSGLVYHHVPAYLLRNRMPTYETNCIEDWEEKIEAICRETSRERMTLISGIPPWVIMYFERLLALNKVDTIRDLFPDFSLFVHGGVNFQPYAARLQELIGGHVDTLETYPASEGFMAFQDNLEADGLLLNVASGIWFEFIPMDRYHEPDPPRLSVEEVEIGVQYALIVNNNAGLWGYRLGDTIRFTSLHPARIVVTGRTAHFLSAFGEHVIAEEVEGAMQSLREQLGVEVVEFTVAPRMGDGQAMPRHEWFVEFSKRPDSMVDATALLDRAMQARNTYYKDLVTGSILAPLALFPIRPGGFRDYQRSVGKLGGQNKVARLANNRTIADALQPYLDRTLT
ncbi:MAG: hypothetical protein GC205_02240 [Bacteroidetes bacterium]|nr:hypothetical protein [Bacteroidota bacterium]